MGDAYQGSRRGDPGPARHHQDFEFRRCAGAIQEALVALGDNKHKDFRLDLVSLALKGKKVSFDKVIGMITEMIGILNEEQASDSKKKSYCETEIDKTEDELKSTQRKVA